MNTDFQGIYGNLRPEYNQCLCPHGGDTADSFSSGISPMTALVVKSNAAILAPFCNAVFTTFDASTIPDSTISVNFSPKASYPKLPVPSFTFWRMTLLVRNLRIW